MDALLERTIFLRNRGRGQNLLRDRRQSQQLTELGELDTLDGSTPINYREEAFKEYKEWLDDVFDEALVKALSGEVDPECPKFLTWDAAVDEVKQSNNRSL